MLRRGDRGTGWCYHTQQMAVAAVVNDARAIRRKINGIKRELIAGDAAAGTA